MNPDQQQMQQMGPPPKIHTPFWVPTQILSPIVVPNIINPYQCDQLKELFEDNEHLQTAGMTGSRFEPSPDSEIANNPDVRNVKIIRILENFSNDQMIQNVVNGIMSIVDQVNQSSFRFDIDAFHQIELAKYDEGGKYEFHTDTGAFEASRCRKLSFSLSLTDEEEYSGGELSFFGIQPPPDQNLTPEELKTPQWNYKPPVGSIVIFPSFMPHKVNPVTEGTRYSMFGWFEGPRFK
jgi:PKHD-type hydroxylase